MTPPLFIIGYMACGKTTFGRALARATGREFIDLDFYIEQRFRMSISRIFAEKGEEEFRRMESAMLPKKSASPLPKDSPRAFPTTPAPPSASPATNSKTAARSPPPSPTSSPPTVKS